MRKASHDNDMGESDVIVYVQSQGPICYTVPSIHNRASYTEFAGELASAGIGWCWESSREPEDDTYNNPGLPNKRPLTQLTAKNMQDMQALTDDLRERNSDGYGRSLGLFGMELTAVQELLDESRLRATLKDFASHEGGPILIVLVQEYDDPFTYIFVPHQPIEPVSRLLETWGITPKTVRRARKYKRLLESMFKL
jgi:hypothetical protein